jgi:hypothetical protein
LTMLISFFAAYLLYIVNKKVLSRRTNIRIRP